MQAMLQTLICYGVHRSHCSSNILTIYEHEQCKLERYSTHWNNHYLRTVAAADLCFLKKLAVLWTVTFPGMA